MNKALKLVGLAALVVLLSLSLRGWSGHSDTDDTPEQRALHAQLEGKPMPTLQVEGWVNGEVTPEQMKGKVVLLDFWATWCGPCLASIPRNNELYRRYKDRGLLVVGICTGGTGEEKMQEVAASNGMEYPTAKDVDIRTGTTWHVEMLPTYALVDRRGIVRVIGISDDRIETVIQKLLAESAKDGL